MKEVISFFILVFHSSGCGKCGKLFVEKSHKTPISRGSAVETIEVLHSISKKRVEKEHKTKKLYFSALCSFSLHFCLFLQYQGALPSALVFLYVRGCNFCEYYYLFPLFTFVLPPEDPAERDLLPLFGADRRSASLRILCASSPKILPSFLPPVLPL